jgi:repressor LexA
MKGLSVRQQKMLGFIRRFVDEKAYPPTIRDIVSGCGISSTSVADYNLQILENAGYIRRRREVSRGIQLVQESNPGFLKGVPVLGQIAAGQPIPIPSSESFNGRAGAELLEVPPELIRGRENVFALRVKGLSMIDALINDGDLVLLEPAVSVENGEMAAVWLKREHTATLKKVFVGPAQVRLQPANSQMEPIYLKPEEVEIQGRVVGVVRKLT